MAKHSIISFRLKKCFTHLESHRALYIVNNKMILDARIFAVI